MSTPRLRRKYRAGHANSRVSQKWEFRIRRTTYVGTNKRQTKRGEHPARSGRIPKNGNSESAALPMWG